MVEHDQSIVNSETRINAELGLTDWLAANLMLPFRVFDTHIHYLDPQTGQEVTIEDPNLHHRNEVLTGIADPWLGGRLAAAVGGVTASVRLGTTIPLGSTVPNPFVLGDMGLPHEHTQFGTGTFEPIAGVEAYRTFGGVNVDAYWLTIQSLYENSHGYQAGNRYAFGASAASSLGFKTWRFRAMLDRFSESAERWNGMVNTTEGNIGRVDVMAGLEAVHSFNDDWRVALALKVPVYTHVVGGQVDTPLYASLTISTHTHLWKKTHTASTAALVPVAGKVTVFDYWATWCKPCKQLDHELTEVVRRHPEDLVVKKIEVDEPDFDLPHVVLYGRDGALVWERSGGPTVLAAAVEDAVGPPAPPAEPVATPAQPAKPTQPAKPAPPAARRVAITVTDSGYTPERVTIPAGQPVVLVFTRTSEKTCAVDVHFTLPDGTKIDQRLPLNQPVEIPVRVERAGEITYACGMDMLHGHISIQ